MFFLDLFFRERKFFKCYEVFVRNLLSECYCYLRVKSIVTKPFSKVSLHEILFIIFLFYQILTIFKTFFVYYETKIYSKV